jgi:hypothetical protein
MLMTARVVPDFAGQGLGRVLVQGAAKDVMRRGVRAIEAFGYLGDPDSARASCLIPARFLTAVGFKTVREHRIYPRLRLDLRTALTWREDMEAAVERLLAAVRSPSLSQGRRASDARVVDLKGTGVVDLKGAGVVDLKGTGVMDLKGTGVMDLKGM